MIFRTRVLLMTICFSLVSVVTGYAKTYTTDPVVKIFVFSNRMDFYRPWQSTGSSSSGGSGSVIVGNKILTNAHVVSDNTFIQVKKSRDPKKYTAHLEAIAHDCDLALLIVDDPKFFDDIEPLDFGKLPELRDSVTVVGYPAGGDKVSITEGVVSRLEITSYTQSARALLTVQIDAAINPGNSGGPVIQNGKIVGVVMQMLQSGQNIGYMIPIPVIDHFFKDLDDGNYDGFPVLGIDYNKTENPTLRKLYKIEDDNGGILVTKVLPYSPADNILMEDDVILSMDGVALGEDGTFEFRENERLLLTHLITQKQIGEELELEIKRKGKNKKIKLPITPFKILVPYPKHFDKPSYFIYGGMVFTVLSTDLLKSWGKRWWEQAPIDFNYYLMGRGRFNDEAREEIVVLLNVLPDDINVGYHSYGNDVVKSINGKDISSFKDLVELLIQAKNNEQFTVIKTERHRKIIIANDNLDEIDANILKRNNIVHQYSDDVKPWIE